MISWTSATDCSWRTVIGSMIMPDSDFLTFSTSRTCWSMLMFLWMMPMPPSLAMAMAVRCSVTVSIAELISGVLSLMVSVSMVASDTSVGRTSEAAGTSSRSSKVSAVSIVSGNIVPPFRERRRWDCLRGHVSLASGIDGPLQPPLQPQACSWSRRVKYTSGAAQPPCPHVRQYPGWQRMSIVGV